MIIQTFTVPETADTGAFLWGVEFSEGRWSVVESYSEGRSWGRNCFLPSFEECLQFIASWWDDNVEPYTSEESPQ